MKVRKIFITSIIINILTIGIIYNFIKKGYLNNNKLILKTMSETEYEDNITSLNQSHENYAKFIQDSKTKIASAITDMGVETSNEVTPDTIVNNIKNIARDAYSISFDNISSGLASTNVQNAIDEIDGEVDELNETLDNYEYIGEINSLNGSLTIDRNKYKRIYIQLIHGDIGIVNSHEIPNIINGKYSSGRFLGSYFLSEYWNVSMGVVLDGNNITMDTLQVVGYGDYTICKVYAK